VCSRRSAYTTRQIQANNKHHIVNHRLCRAVPIDSAVPASNNVDPDIRYHTQEMVRFLKIIFVAAIRAKSRMNDCSLTMDIREEGFYSLYTLTPLTPEKGGGPGSYRKGLPVPVHRQEQPSATVYRKLPDRSAIRARLRRFGTKKAITH